MTRNERSIGILKTIQDVNFRCDALIREIHENIESTKRELAERKRKRENKYCKNTSEITNKNNVF